MQTARRRTTWAIVASAIAHLVVVIVVLLQRPVLVMPPGESGPPEAIIPILIVPKTPPPAAGRLAKPAPIRLHRRPQPFLPPEAPTAPIAPPGPSAPATAPGAPPGPVTLHPSPLPEGPKGDARTALRAGTPGCANRDAVGLNRAERELCDEKFGKGAKDAAFPGLGLAADKQRLLDAAGAKKDADSRYYKYGQPMPTPNIDRPGATAEDMAKGMGNDRSAAKLPY